MKNFIKKLFKKHNTTDEILTNCLNKLDECIALTEQSIDTADRINDIISK